MVSVAAEIVEAHIQLIIDEVAFKTRIETLCCLPLQVGIANVLEG